MVSSRHASDRRADLRDHRPDLRDHSRRNAHGGGGPRCETALAPAQASHMPAAPVLGANARSRRLPPNRLRAPAPGYCLRTCRVPTDPAAPASCTTGLRSDGARSGPRTSVCTPGPAEPCHPDACGSRFANCRGPAPRGVSSTSRNQRRAHEPLDPTRDRVSHTPAVALRRLLGPRLGDSIRTSAPPAPRAPPRNARARSPDVCGSRSLTL